MLFQQPDIRGKNKVLLSSPLLRPPEQQQRLVLEDISPIWASRLKKENLPTFMSPNWWKWHYELKKASKCVVGEAYGYSSQYTADCNECERISVKFLYYFALNLRGRLESNKQDFVKHWNEEHNKDISLLLGHAEKHADKRHNPLSYDIQQAYSPRYEGVSDMIRVKGSGYRPPVAGIPNTNITNTPPGPISLYY